MSKENINLPKTSFPMKADLPNKEPEILKIWKELNLYKKLRISGSLLGKFAFIENEVLGKLIFSLLIKLTLFLNFFLQKLHLYSFALLIFSNY